MHEVLIVLLPPQTRLLPTSCSFEVEVRDRSGGEVSPSRRHVSFLPIRHHFLPFLGQHAGFFNGVEGFHQD